MNLFDLPEQYEAHPPRTWTVERRAQGRTVEYRVMIAPGRCADTEGTRADAQRVIDRPDSWLRRQYDKEAAAALSRDGAAVLS